MIVKVLFILVMIVACVISEPRFTIGGIFYEDAEDLKQAFNVSAKTFEFNTLVAEVPKTGDFLHISDHVCEFAKAGVVGIIDGVGGQATELIQALCDTLEIPLITIQQNEFYTLDWTLINLYPSPIAFNNLLTQLVTKKEWKEFTLLYVKGYSMSNVYKLLEMSTQADLFTITVRELSGEDYRDVLTEAKESGYVNFVVDCPSAYLEPILSQAQQVSLMSDEHSYIFVSPDLFALDLSRYRYGGVNMTGFRLITLKSNNRLWDFTSSFNAESANILEAENLRTEEILIYDAVLMLSDALYKVNVTTQELDCEQYGSWAYGSTLLNFMKTSKSEGLTKSLNFDGFGQRNKVIVDVLELTPAGNQSIGTWDGDKLIISRSKILATEIGEETIMKNKTFKVLIATTPPYGFIKESIFKLEGNDRFEGFTIDLIGKLADMLGFNYEFELEADYGKLNNGSWTGMIYKIREDKADFAICDLTITKERQKGIDFSTPFMSLGISILYKEPSKQPPEMFSFMAVFSKEVWYYMVLVQLGLGVLMIFVGRISNKEWQNPVPCVEQPEELSNQFSLANSVWLIIGSVMQQGSEIAPIALAPRIITSVWWFFTMVMVASYVGTLVAFLIVEKNVMPFQTVDELYEQKHIAYGAKENGSTVDFFKYSTNPKYNEMHATMKRRGWIVSNNDIGVEKTEKGNFAFFMESTSIEYTKERHCDLIQVGELLDSKNYGIGMKKKSPYKRYIDSALLKLKESGEIQKLKEIWWKEKRDGGKCGKKQDKEQKQLGMKNMLGAFVVLGVGCPIGLVIAIIDMMWGVFKRSVKYNTTFKYELIEELKFALKFSGDIKPVKRPQREASEDAEKVDLERKDELMSLRSLRSERSSDTHRTHHSHGSSRHSPMSIAFARRREYS
ncbi:glutamate receptor ionotropic, kainate 3-like isoform X1 [Maniola jurtina]|uniref:glutamate receptor ionotropic, kainate 3-like isoform X1 n=2 Tax=Maniola jurtina TaxID=191418 RepID=UPI001E685F75|nr:glutamate receptor ionotropic, kainate 3-like isoform X1 [Maniola jurtina]